jgi:HEAT repeat protein
MGDAAPVEDLDALLVALPTGRRRDLVALALGKLGQKQAIPDLERIARTTDELATPATVYLGWMGERSADEQLLALLKVEDWRLRTAAARGLQGTRHPAAAQRLAEVIDLDESQDALVLLGVDAIPAVLDVLREEYAKTDDVASVHARRWGIVRVLQRIGALAYGVLLEVLRGSDDARVKEAVADAIASSCRYKGVGSENDVGFLSQVGPERLATDLVAVLLATPVDEEHRMLRISITKASEEIGSREALPGLKSALNREVSDQVRRYIERAIEAAGQGGTAMRTS